MSVSLAIAHGRVAPSRVHFVATDGILAAGVWLVSLALLSQTGPGPWSPAAYVDVASAALTAASAAPLVFWRRSPVAVFVLCGAGSVVTAAFGYALGLPPAPTVALFLVAASRTATDPWTTRTTAASVALLIAFLFTTGAARSAFPGTEVLHGTLFWCLAWFAGDRTRLAHEHVKGLADRAQRAERDAQQELRLAVAEERARIARDIHDSAGQAASLIAMRAGTARLRYANDPERALAALESIEQLARNTAADIDSIVGALRDHGAAVENGDPPIGLASLATLIGHHEAGGLRVALRQTGSALTLAAPVDQAAYRILQEALANAARHGTGTAEVDVNVDRAEVRLTITNPVAEGADAPVGAGRHGLVGMRERATLIGGHLATGVSDGAFRVAATLPALGREDR